MKLKLEEGEVSELRLTKALLDELGLKPGEYVSLVRTEDGLKISEHDAEFNEQMRLGRAIMKHRESTMRDLAGVVHPAEK